jgi:alginate production protein
MTLRTLMALVVVCTPWAAAAQSQTAPVEPAPADEVTAPVPGLRPDERRSDKPVTLDVFGSPVELGLSYEVTHERRLNFDLDATRQRGRDVIDHEVKLDARGRACNTIRWSLQGVALADRRQASSDGAAADRHAFERGQTWLLFERVGGLPWSVQAGRIALIERRSWWWDDDLDAVRLSYTPAEPTLWRFETGLAHEVLKRSSGDRGVAPALKGVTRWFGHTGVRWAPEQTLEGLWLVAQDQSGQPAAGTRVDAGTEDSADARQAWLGLRASGEARFDSGHRLIYRADAALLRGRETRTPFDATATGQLAAGDSSTRRVRGRAWDLGAQWRLPGDARPTFSLNLARGSGGVADATQDRNFRQTGLQENKGRVAGVKRIRYYGELLDPELSNLQVATLGFGVRVLANSSAELMLHQYRQAVVSTRLTGSRLAQDPAGTNRDIGRELDLLFAVREFKHVELTLKLARFLPGAAFAVGRRDAAHSVEIGATLTF